MGEAVGEVAERPSLRVELLLEVRAEHAGLDAGEAGRCVHGEHSAKPRDVERDDRALLLRRSLEAARDAGPATERDEHRVGVQGGAHDRRHLVLVGRPDDDVREPAEVAATVPYEVTQALAARVDDAVERIGGDVAYRGLERGGQTWRQRRLGDVQTVEGGRLGDRAADVDVEVALQERPERRLVLVREGDALVSPPPPPHRGLPPPSVSVTAHDAPRTVGDHTRWRRTGSVRSGASFPLARLHEA